MRLLALEPERYGYALALLAVHATISLADAIALHHSHDRSKSEDHADAVRLLEKICPSRAEGREGLKHFSWLIARKNRIAYEHHALDMKNEIIGAKLHAERFFAWVTRTFDIPKASVNL